MSYGMNRLLKDGIETMKKYTGLANWLFLFLSQFQEYFLLLNMSDLFYQKNF
jgi:hypothetical protein